MVTSTGFVFSTANSILVVFCQQQSFLHKMLLWWYLVQELYDFFFRRFLIEIRSNPDVLVELPEGSVPVGAYPAHQVVLQLRNVSHRQLKDLLLIIISVPILGSRFRGILSSLRYLYHFFLKNSPSPSSRWSSASQEQFFPASEVPSPRLHSSWQRSALFCWFRLDLAPAQLLSWLLCVFMLQVVVVVLLDGGFQATCAPGSVVLVRLSCHVIGTTERADRSCVLASPRWRLKAPIALVAESRPLG